MNISNNTFWAIALARKWVHTEKEKNLWPWRGSNPRSPEQITVALPSELQGQMGAGRGKLKWYFAANEHESEGVTSKIWSRSTIKHI